MSEQTRPQATDEFREKLRHEMIARREALEPDALSKMSAQLALHLGSLIEHLAPSCIGFCWPWRGEFDGREVMRRWLAGGAGRRAALPVIEQVAAPMRFREWAPDCEMTTGRFGIDIPATGPWLVPDVFLLPLVAVDLAGYRLGYGGGYFDRTLAALKPRPVAIGIGFDFQHVASIGPQPWDERLDWVLTETGARAV